MLEAAHMIFSEDGYSIMMNGEKVELLRKEFLLLKYLYVNQGRAFSRVELLDAIWPHEHPTDRTVDDHIYRLRKKMNRFQDTIVIKTIKGLGYSLQLKEQRQEVETIPKEIEQQATELFETYYKYGQGKALRELLTNKVLGLPLNEKQEIVLLWLNSDFRTLLKRLADKGNAFVPLLLYGFVESDTEKVIKAHERILEKKLLDEKERMDVTSFSLSLWYLKLDRPKRSLQLVQQEMDHIEDIHHGFFRFST